ncbi:universal stress protein A-like protein [Impatiens glandulifera]|uniref:universal stress protein A-like protein n=1 Tax=Impatiens glandulifera TaxID=253017 RepID=UPI001FB08D7A|nr:universal stress protein A-like protein [Impatiens glandulifera]XP_047314391.1 universal stress protein A-like protein [Impatiens glandulifera]
MASIESSKKVMVAIDEAEASYHTFMWVIKNLHESITNSGNPLLIFFAQPSAATNNVFAASLGGARIYSPLSSTHDCNNSVDEKNKIVATKILEKAKIICDEYKISAETIVGVGDPKEAICEAVKKNDITLLVIAGEEQGAVKRVLTWSVSNYCVQYANCNVLVVKKP